MSEMGSAGTVANGSANQAKDRGGFYYRHSV